MLKTRQIGHCFAGEASGIDLSRLLSPATPPRSTSRARGRPSWGAPTTQDLASTEPGPDRARHRHGAARGRAPPHHVRGCVQPRPGQQGLRAGVPDAALRAGQPSVALRQLVQGGAREVLHPAFAQRAVVGRQHRICRHARGLRRPRRGNAQGDRGPHLRALPDLLTPAGRPSASPTSPTRSAPASRRCASAWCARIPRPGGSPSFLLRHAGGILGWPVPEARAFLRRPRRSTPPSASSSTRTSGRWATS